MRNRRNQTSADSRFTSRVFLSISLRTYRIPKITTRGTRTQAVSSGGTRTVLWHRSHIPATVLEKPIWQTLQIGPTCPIAQGVEPFEIISEGISEKGQAVSAKHFSTSNDSASLLHQPLAVGRPPRVTPRFSQIVPFGHFKHVPRNSGSGGSESAE